MLIQERLEENPSLIKSYSDAGFFIVNQYGELYAEAIDVATRVESGDLVWTETDQLIPVPEEEPEE